MPYGLQARRSRVHWGSGVAIGDQPRLTKTILHALAPAVRPDEAVLATAFATDADADHFLAMQSDGVLITPAKQGGPAITRHPLTDMAWLAARLANSLAVYALSGTWVRGSHSSTKIEWAEATWNPWWGCSIASAGCNNCYAASFAHRGTNKSLGRTVTKVTPRGVTWNGKTALNSDTQQYAPVLQPKPTLWFTASMTDVFHESVPTEWLVEMHDVMRHTPHHVYQILTKRPERARTFYAARPHLLMPNMWLGTSVEDNRVMHRIDTLRMIPVPADRRWLSLEPLIGSLSPLNLDGIRWVITGGESGYPSRARACNPTWVREIRDVCLRADVPFFHKQWGRYESNPFVQEQGMSEAQARALDSTKTNGKGGAILDGRLWRDVPDWRDGHPAPADPRSHRVVRSAPTPSRNSIHQAAQKAPDRSAAARKAWATRRAKTAASTP